MEATIRCIIQACERLRLDYRLLDRNRNLLLVADHYYFQLSRTPFNSEVMASLCKDKEHQYDSLHHLVNIPKTQGFLDYNTTGQFQQYLRCDSRDSTVAAIEAEFDYPLVIKPNQGSLGVNVFCCRDRQAVITALETIFDRRCRDYDCVAIAQAFVHSQQEFRVVCFDGEPVLCYQRVSAQAEFGARYWQTADGRAVLHTTDGIARRVATEFAPALRLPGLRYVGLDVIRSRDDQLYLIELNSAPRVDQVIKSNGEAPVVAMYQTVLQRYLADPAAGSGVGK